MPTYTDKQSKRMSEIEQDLKDIECLIDEMYRKSDKYTKYKDAENAYHLALDNDYPLDILKVLGYHFESMGAERTIWIENNYPVLQKTFRKLFNEGTTMYLEFTK